MSLNKVERYLIDLTISYSEIGSDLWLVEDEAKGLYGIVVALDEPIVLVRLAVMKVPADNKEKCYQKLLELNASQIIHGAYAVDQDEVILIDTLNYESMDLADFQTSIESIGLAAVQHYPILAEFNK